MTVIGLLLFAFGIVAVTVANRYQWVAARQLVRKRPKLSDSIYGNIPGMLKWNSVRQLYKQEFPNGNKTRLSDLFAAAGFLAAFVAIAILLFSGRR